MSRRAHAQRRQPEPRRLRRLAPRHPPRRPGLTLFTIAIAAAEIGIGLAIVLMVYRSRAPPTSTSSATTRAETAGTGDASTRTGAARGGGHRVTTTTLAVLVPSSRSSAPPQACLLGRTAPGFDAAARGAADPGRPGRRRRGRRTAGRTEAVDATTQLTPTGSSRSSWPCTSTDSAVLTADARRTGRLVRADLLHGATSATTSAPPVVRGPRWPLFTSLMLLVVYSGDLMVLLVGWEIMGICSYFLVGHYWETPEARAASLKAFLVTKLGDVPFLIGLFALDRRRRNLPDHRDPRLVARRRHRPPDARGSAPAGRRRGEVRPVLHTWLPDAMAGPTPVSASSSTPRPWSPRASTSSRASPAALRPPPPP